MDDEAFCVNSTATTVVKAEGDQLEWRSIQMPQNAVFMQELRMRYKSSTEDNHIDVTDRKATFMGRIQRDLNRYYLFKDDPQLTRQQTGQTQELIMQLLVKKYMEASSDPFKLKANREFLQLQKIVLQNAYEAELARRPLACFDRTKRIEKFDDELTYVSALARIEAVQVSSEPARNFALVQMEGVLFKYDLVTKELLQRFKTQQTRAALLYQQDDKICTVSDHAVRLWDFDDVFEKPPAIWATEEFDSKTTVDRVFVNEGIMDP